MALSSEGLVSGLTEGIGAFLQTRSALEDREAKRKANEYSLAKSEMDFEYKKARLEYDLDELAYKKEDNLYQRADKALTRIEMAAKNEDLSAFNLNEAANAAQIKDFATANTLATEAFKQQYRAQATAKLAHKPEQLIQALSQIENVNVEVSLDDQGNMIMTSGGQSSAIPIDSVRNMYAARQKKSLTPEAQRTYAINMAEDATKTDNPTIALQALKAFGYPFKAPVENIGMNDGVATLAYKDGTKEKINLSDLSGLQEKEASKQTNVFNAKNKAIDAELSQLRDTKDKLFAIVSDPRKTSPESKAKLEAINPRIEALLAEKRANVFQYDLMVNGGRDTKMQIGALLSELTPIVGRLSNPGEHSPEYLQAAARFEDLKEKANLPGMQGKMAEQELMKASKDLKEARAKSGGFEISTGEEKKIKETLAEVKEYADLARMVMGPGALKMIGKVPEQTLQALAPYAEELGGIEAVFGLEPTIEEMNQIVAQQGLQGETAAPEQQEQAGLAPAPQEQGLAAEAAAPVGGVSKEAHQRFLGDNGIPDESDYAYKIGEAIAALQKKGFGKDEIIRHLRNAKAAINAQNFDYFTTFYESAGKVAAQRGKQDAEQMVSNQIPVRQ